MAEVQDSSRQQRASETRKLAGTLKDSKWVVKEWENLKKKYGDSFIAVLDCRVIAHHRDMKVLMDIVDRKVPDRKNYVTTEFINLKEIRWLR